MRDDQPQAYYSTYWLHNSRYTKVVPLDNALSYLVHHMPNSYAPACNDAKARASTNHQIAGGAVRVSVLFSDAEPHSTLVHSVR